jgi:hypothetical protein
MSENRELIKFTKFTLLTPRRNFFMNKKFVGIFAVSVVALASSIIAAPADAAMKEVDLSVDVQQAIQLRTFQGIDLRVSPGDFKGVTDSDYDPKVRTDGTLSITPYSGNIPSGTSETGRIITKNVRELFSVSSNSSTTAATTVEVTITGPTDNRLTKTGGGSTDSILIQTIAATGGSVTGNKTTGPSSFGTPFTGGVDLTFNLGAAPAGIYTGILKVDAIAK